MKYFIIAVFVSCFSTAKAQEMPASDFYKYIVSVMGKAMGQGPADYQGVYSGELRDLGGKCDLAVLRNLQTSDLKFAIETGHGFEFSITFPGKTQVKKTFVQSPTDISYDEIYSIDGYSLTIRWLQSAVKWISIQNSSTSLACEYAL